MSTNPRTKEENYHEVGELSDFNKCCQKTVMVMSYQYGMEVLTSIVICYLKLFGIVNHSAWHGHCSLQHPWQKFTGFYVLF